MSMVYASIACLILFLLISYIAHLCHLFTILLYIDLEFNVYLHGSWIVIIQLYFQINGELKPELIAILTAATYYIKAYCAIFPSETLPQGFLNSNQTHEFWPLIHALARHGVYAVDKEEQVVSSAALAQRTPFKEV